MASLLTFPVRNPYASGCSHDSLARDTQQQALRIAEQVENEIARQTVGMRIECAGGDPQIGPRSMAPVLSMPVSHQTPTPYGTMVNAARAVCYSLQAEIFDLFRRL